MKNITILIMVILFGLGIKGQNFEDLEFGTDTTFEAVSWNIEWFPKNGQTTANLVADIIRALDVDVLALQEISDTVVFKQMVSNLEGYEAYFLSGWYAGLAYLYKPAVVSINSIYEIYTTQPYWSPFPRSPMVMELVYRGKEMIVINNHFKCCGDGILDPDDEGDEETRRLIASNLLKEYIDTNFSDQCVILLGDLNDILTDVPANNVFQAFIDDFSNYHFADMEVAEGPVSGWSYPSWPSHIDHILITNELFDAFYKEGSATHTIAVDEHFEGGFDAYDEDVSDHRPVGIRLNIEDGVGIFDKEEPRVMMTNYPNPFLHKTTISFNTNQQHLTVKIYNNKGMLIQVLTVPENQFSVQWDASTHPGGVYYAKLFAANSLQSIRKIVVTE